MSEEKEDTRTYKVVKNEEEQYSIMLATSDVPPGWMEVGKTGSRSECMTWVDEVWTDMRPLSLRRQMAEWAAQQTAEPAADE